MGKILTLVTLPQSIMLSGIETLRYCIKLHSKELLVHKEQSTLELSILQNKAIPLCPILVQKVGSLSGK